MVPEMVPEMVTAKAFVLGLVVAKVRRAAGPQRAMCDNNVESNSSYSPETVNPDKSYFTRMLKWLSPYLRKLVAV